MIGKKVKLTLTDNIFYKQKDLECFLQKKKAARVVFYAFFSLEQGCQTHFY